MHLPTVFRPRLKPLARLMLLLGGLPLAALAADGEGGAESVPSIALAASSTLQPMRAGTVPGVAPVAVGEAASDAPASPPSPSPSPVVDTEGARLANNAPLSIPAPVAAADADGDADAKRVTQSLAPVTEPTVPAVVPAILVASSPPSVDTSTVSSPVQGAVAQEVPVAPATLSAGSLQVDEKPVTPASAAQAAQAEAAQPPQPVEPAVPLAGAALVAAAPAAAPAVTASEPSSAPSSAPAQAPVAVPVQVSAAQTAAAPVSAAPALAALSSEPGILGAPGPAGPAGEEPPPGDKLVLKTEPELKPGRPASDEVPVFVQGMKISGQTGVQTVVEGDAELRKRGSLIKAETITYFPVDDELLAREQVRVLKEGDLFVGSELRLKLDAQTGYFLDVNYLMAGEKARGEARRLDFLGQNAYNAEDATYTTCGPGNDDWFLKVGKLNLDFGRDVGEAEDAQIVFLGRKIMQLPSMSFTLNDRRKSGFLAPSFGSSVQSGAEATIPYYWNIAPNRDLTVSERYMTKRGLQSSAAFRYLGESYKGQISGEVLPNDHQTNTTRSGFSILHQQVLAPGLLGSLDVNKVSDNTYFTDLSARLALTAQTYLNREGSLSYTNDGYNFMARAQSYQTLQDPLNPVTVPYFRLPQLTFSTTRYDIKGFDLSMSADFTRFSSAVQVTGNRLILNPSISYPFITPGFYITPKLTFNSTRYSLDDLSVWQAGYSTPANAKQSIVRNLPLVSLDSGMTFERPASFLGNDYTQTLEPRIYYLRVPYTDQSNIPVFDSGLADFNFSQIFSENRYSGYDRIGDANQITAAISTRLLSTTNGGERLRASIGQRYYFTTQRVTLPGEVPRASKSSDFLASLSGEIIDHVRADSAVEYNPETKQVQRVSHGVRWSPEPGNTVSAAYRYQRDLLEQVDFAAQWRVAPRWYGLGRYNYSLRDGRVVEALGGFEYDGDCWVGRVVVQRYALATQKASTSIFFQIELNGLSKLGSNPLDILKRNIPGYTKLNDATAPQSRILNNYE